MPRNPSQTRPNLSLEDDEDDEDFLFTEDEDEDEYEDDDLEEDDTVDSSTSKTPNPDYTQAYVSLMSDPDIQRIVQARNSGQNVQISVGSEDETAHQPSDDDIEEELDRILEKYEGDDKEQLKTGLKRTIQKATGTLSERLKNLEGFIETEQSQRVKDQVTEARKRYKDFDRHANTMAKIARENPNLSINEIYHLAKLRSGEEALKKPETTDVEKPTQAPKTTKKKKKVSKKSSRTSSPKSQRTSGRKGFTGLLAEALENVDVSPQE